MRETDFDDKIRNLVNSLEETVDGDVWTKIEVGLMRGKRMMILKKVSYYVAVAASLVIGTFLIVPNDRGSKPILVLAEAETTERIELEKKQAFIEKEVITENVDNKARVQESIKTLKNENFYVREGLSTQSPRGSSVQESMQEFIPELAQDSIQELVQQSAKESLTKEVKKDVSNKEVQKKKYKTISEQIDESSYLAMIEEVDKPKRNMSFGLLSNVNAGKSLSDNESSLPSFSSGQGSSSNYGVVPISAINSSLPVTFGVQLRLSLGERFGVGVGANYTFLHSKYEAIIDGRTQGLVSQSLNYIGVPLSLYYNILQTNSMKFYVSGGGMIEKGLRVNYDILNLNGNTTSRKEKIAGVQWSVNVGLGFEYRFIDLMGIYVDPSLIYFFEGSQPYSIRTSQPLQFRLEVGFRFHLQ